MSFTFKWYINVQKKVFLKEKLQFLLGDTVGSQHKENRRPRKWSGKLLAKNVRVCIN